MKTTKSPPPLPSHHTHTHTHTQPTYTQRPKETNTEPEREEGSLLIIRTEGFFWGGKLLFPFTREESQSLRWLHFSASPPPQISQKMTYVIEGRIMSPADPHFWWITGRGMGRRRHRVHTLSGNPQQPPSTVYCVCLFFFFLFLNLTVMCTFVVEHLPFHNKHTI